MSASLRKDRGIEEVVAPNNAVLKQIGGINSPYSPQATGLDKIPEANVTDDLDALTPAMECIEGNRRGVIKSIADDNAALPLLVSAVIEFKSEDAAGPVIDVTYTRAELEKSSITFFKQQLEGEINV